MPLTICSTLNVDHYNVVVVPVPSVKVKMLKDDKVDLDDKHDEDDAVDADYAGNEFYRIYSPLNLRFHSFWVE